MCAFFLIYFGTSYVRSINRLLERTCYQVYAWYNEQCVEFWDRKSRRSRCHGSYGLRKDTSVPRSRTRRRPCRIHLSEGSKHEKYRAFNTLGGKITHTLGRSSEGSSRARWGGAHTTKVITFWKYIVEGIPKTHTSRLLFELSLLSRKPPLEIRPA